MVIYFTLDKNGYVEAYGSTPFNVESELSVELGEHHDFFQSDPFTFKFVNGDLVKDEEYTHQRKEEREQEENEPSEIERLKMAIMELAILTLNGGKGDE